MRRIVGSVFLSLDGVMQAPGGPTEDWTGGFDHGGWLFGYDDPAIGDVVGGLFSSPYALLLGRKTYDIFAAYWPYVGGEQAEFAESLNRADKHVLTHQTAPLEWENSHRLADVDAIATLKETEGPDLLIQGSSTLYPLLLRAGLLDRLTTLTFPIVLGQGKRLFREGTPSGTFALAEHQVSAMGTVIATYEPAGEVRVGSFAPTVSSAREEARQERMKREEAAA
jgi:dihydrofolate reductase